MKRFAEYLLEGQEEVEAAIKGFDAAIDRARKIWHARGRLETMLKRANNTFNPDAEYYRLNRLASKKVQQRVNPPLKKIFHDLSPEDRMQFLLSPYSSVDERDKDYFVGKTMYDKLVRLGKHESMFPLKDFRDAEDILSVVRSTPIRRAFHAKDRNMSDSKQPAQVVDISDDGKDIVKGGTFHERKKLRKKA